MPKPELKVESAIHKYLTEKLTDEEVNVMTTMDSKDNSTFFGFSPANPLFLVLGFLLTREGSRRWSI